MDAFLSSLDPWMVYWTVGLLAFGESAAFLGLVMPGEVALVAAAALASTMGIDPVLLALVAGVASTAGGLVGFEMGRRYGEPMMQWRPIRRRFGRAAVRFARRLDGVGADSLVTVSRFNQVSRAVVPVLAGMSPMTRSRFAVFNAVGAVSWAAVFSLIGFFAAEWWRASSMSVQAVAAAAFAAAVGAWVAINKSVPSRKSST